MLTEKIKARVLQAMRDKDIIARDVLRVALSDLQAAESRDGKTLSDEQAGRIIRKIIKSNDESLAVTKDPATVEKLQRENVILDELLPSTLDHEGIKAALAPVADAIRNAGNDGQATGIAMKHLKSTGAPVEGNDVAVVVKQLRG